MHDPAESRPDVTDAPAAVPAGDTELGLRAIVTLRWIPRLSGDFARTAVFAAVQTAALVASRSLALDPASAHGAAFVLAAAAFLVVPARGGGVRPVGDLAGLARFLAVAVVSLSVSSGILTIAAAAGAPAAVAALACSAGAGAVLAAGTAAFVRRAPAETPETALRRVCAAFVVASLVVRLVYLPLAPLLPEEAYYWNYSQHPALGYLDHPPMVAWLIRAGTAVFGRTELGVRAVPFLCWFVAVVCTMRLTRRLAGAAAAIVAAALMSVLPFFVGDGFAAMPDAPMTACWAAALMFLERALLGDGARAWWGVGIAIGLGMLSKYPIALVGASALVFMAAERSARRWFRHGAPYGAVLLAGLLFTPVVWWNATHGWASIAFQSTGRLVHHRFDLHTYFGAILFAATPLGVAAAWTGLRRSGADGGGLDGRARRFCLVFTAVPLLVFAAASVRAQTRINWPGPPLLAAIPAMSFAIVRARRDATNRLERWTAGWFAPTAACVTAGFALAVQGVTAGLPVVGFPTPWCAGWAPLAAEVAALEAETARDDGARPVVVGTDKNLLASVLAFYDPAPERPLDLAAANVLGGEGLMYEFWNPAQQLRGRSMVLVTDDESSVTEDRTVRRFGRMDEVRVLDIARDGRFVGRWYARVGHDYRPPRRPGARSVPAPDEPR